VHQIFETEVSGNVIDLCPVGALTTKKYHFTAAMTASYSVSAVGMVNNAISKARTMAGSVNSSGGGGMHMLPGRGSVVIGGDITMVSECIRMWPIYFSNPFEMMRDS